MADRSPNMPATGGLQLEEHRKEDLGTTHGTPAGSAVATGQSDEQGRESEPASKHSLFFTKLNLDVRMMVYDHLYEYLPPLAYKRPKCGMILSCKQASLELSQAAARHLKRYLDDFCIEFQDTHSLPLRLHGTVPLHEGWAKLRSITLSIDIAALLAKSKPEDEKNFFRPEYFDGNDSTGLLWRQLLYLPFNKVTLLVTNTSSPSSSTTTTTTQVPDLSALLPLLRNNLESLGETIGYNYQSYLTALDYDAALEHEYGEPEPHQLNKYGKYDPTPKRSWYDSAEEFRLARAQYKRMGHRGNRRWAIRQWERGDDQGLSAQRIKTREMSFAWDLRTSTSSTSTPQVKLTGQKLMYTPERAEELRKKDELRKLRYENLWPHRFEVKSGDGLVGEMGVAHPKRWELASEEYSDYDGLMTHFKHAEEVESKGIGMKLTKKRVVRGKKGEKGKGKGKAEEAEAEVEEDKTGEDAKEKVGNEG